MRSYTNPPVVHHMSNSFGVSKHNAKYPVLFHGTLDEAKESQTVCLVSSKRVFFTFFTLHPLFQIAKETVCAAGLS